jgi:hypothetical protein
MNTYQKNYLKAKAKSEATFETFCEMTKGLDWDADFDKAFDKEEEAREISGYEQASVELRNAQRELFKWGKNTIAKKMKGHPELEKALAVFDKVYLPSHIEKLVKLTLEYNPALD